MCKITDDLISPFPKQHSIPAYMTQDIMPFPGQVLFIFPGLVFINLQFNLTPQICLPGGFALYLNIKIQYGFLEQYKEVYWPTFSSLSLFQNSFQPFLLLFRGFCHAHKPFILCRVVDLPAINNSVATAVVVSWE